jgi:outer membrane protein assembly factor BamA
MSRNLPFSFRSITQVSALVVLSIAFGSVTVRSQATDKTRPLLEFEGNQVFSKQELLAGANKCLDSWTKYDPEQLDYCLHKVTQLMWARGYLQAKLTTARVDELEDRERIVSTVKEGPQYRVGKMKIEGARIFSIEQVRDTIGLRTGEVANGQAISEGLFERMKSAYGKFGYIQYTAEIQPTFHVNEDASEGVVDFDITIDEGAQFKIRSIKFAGGDEQSRQYLRQQLLLLREGDVFVNDLLRESVKRINDTHSYDPIDVDKDVDYRTDQEAPLLDLTIRLKKTGASAASR